MEKDYRIFLDHILECIALIERYTKGRREYHFFESVDLQDKVIHRIEIIGEAVRNLPESFRKANPLIPWKQIAGMRDKLIHEYFGVDLALTWRVVKRDIPKLKRQITVLKRRFPK